MNLEAAVVVGYEGEPLYWHLPQGRTSGYLPDSRSLWDVLWENRHNLYGVAHSHPGSGLPRPSVEDVTTFAGVERGLGRRLVWWIVSQDSLSIVLWAGPGEYNYEILSAEDSTPKWLDELRQRSNYQTEEMKMEAYEAKVNITYKGQNGDLPDPVNFESPNGDILGWVAEAVQTGSVPGINADPTASLTDFVVDRFASTDEVPYNRLAVRPKTPFG